MLQYPFTKFPLKPVHAPLGGHLIGAPALALLEWQLMGAILQDFNPRLRPGGTLGSRISEKGALQLLFDVRFLRDVLAGGRPLSALPEVTSRCVSYKILELP